MVLVEYSESEEECTVLPSSKTQQTLDTTQSNAPPLPSTFKDLYVANVRLSTNDDPDLHSGRKRAVPHVEGNWAAHVYLEYYPSVEDAKHLERLIRDGEQHVRSTQSFLIDDLGVLRPLHISLSAPLVLQMGNKDAFLKALRIALGAVARKINGELVVYPRTVTWHSNEDGSRHFLVLKTGPCEYLWKLLDASNEIAMQFGCPLLYKQSGRGEEVEPFHISIAWSLQLPDTLETSSALPQHIKDMRICFSQVKVKIGQEVTAIPFGGR